MAEYCIKELLGLLREIIPSEIRAETLHFLLRMEPYTAQRLLNGRTRWPGMGSWRNNARKIVEEEDGKYEEFCGEVLKGRQRAELPAAERKQLRKCEEKYAEDLGERLKEAGILRLQGCCYSSDLPTPSEFEKLLTDLVETVLHEAEDCRGTSGKEYVLDFLRQNHGTQADLDRIKACSNYRAMAHFLVKQVDRRHKKPEGRLKASEIEPNVDTSGRVYARIPTLPATGAAGWIGISVCLHDKNWNEVGRWSFLSLAEDEMEQVRKGIRSKDSCADLPVAPGEYIFYRMRLSGLSGDIITSSLDMQRLVDAMWYKLLYYAKKEIYIKRMYFRISDMDAAHESLYRDLGFHLSTGDDGYYVQELVPFPTSLRTAEPEILAELKKRYNRHFLPNMSTS